MVNDQQKCVPPPLEHKKILSRVQKEEEKVLNGRRNFYLSSIILQIYAQLTLKALHHYSSFCNLKSLFYFIFTLNSIKWIIKLDLFVLCLLFCVMPSLMEPRQTPVS